MLFCWVGIVFLCLLLCPIVFVETYSGAVCVVRAVARAGLVSNRSILYVADLMVPNVRDSTAVQGESDRFEQAAAMGRHGLKEHKSCKLTISACSHPLCIFSVAKREVRLPPHSQQGQSQSCKDARFAASCKDKKIQTQTNSAGPSRPSVCPLPSLSFCLLSSFSSMLYHCIPICTFTYIHTHIYTCIYIYTHVCQ